MSNAYEHDHAKPVQHAAPATLMAAPAHTVPGHLAPAPVPGPLAVHSAGPVVGSHYPAQPGAWATPALPASSTGRRFGAYLLEGVLAMVTLGIGWLIWSMITWQHGQTPAKKLMGMRVVRLDTHQPATWGQMALREVVGKGLIGSLSFGITTLVSCFMVLGESRQGVWDKVAGTVVIDEPR